MFGIFFIILQYNLGLYLLQLCTFPSILSLARSLLLNALICSLSHFNIVISFRNLFEEDSGPYDCAISLQRATFVPFLRKSVQEEDNRVDAYGWTLPFSTLGESLEDSFRSFSSEGSIPSHIATLYCCRPVSPQEEVFYIYN